jgi:hypothetical protein
LSLGGAGPHLLGSHGDERPHVMINLQQCCKYLRSVAYAHQGWCYGRITGTITLRLSRCDHTFHG